jgi:flagellar motility protein MotE (MotC chaperone)
MPSENTGPHAIPPPPIVPRDPFASTPPESEPPISAKGASWKTIAAALGVIASIVASALGLSYQIGETSAAQRARDREISAQIEVIDRRTERIDGAQAHHRDELSTHRAELRELRRDVDDNTAEIRALNKRRDRSSNN